MNSLGAKVYFLKGYRSGDSNGSLLTIFSDGVCMVYASWGIIKMLT